MLSFRLKIKHMFLRRTTGRAGERTINLLSPYQYVFYYHSLSLDNVLFAFYEHRWHSEHHRCIDLEAKLASLQRKMTDLEKQKVRSEVN